MRDGMHQQWMELMQAGPVPPIRRQFRGLGVRLLDPLQVGGAEQIEHCQVGLAVPTVCGRVDQQRRAPW